MDARLTDELYVQYRDLLLSRAGLYYPERKRTDLAYGLAMALSASGYSSLGHLLGEAMAGGTAWETLLTHLTIGETYFFRNSAQFTALRQRILPELIARRGPVRSLRVWSAGCATGEEPYSLAILISEALAAREPWSVSILATDINPTFLGRAREALYRDWSFRETRDEVRDRYFTQEELGYRLDPVVRRMVHFARLNLAEPSYPSLMNNTTALDIIVCRNVTIYFDEATTRQVASRFYDALAPGGWLIVGHAEPHAATYHQFDVENFPDTVLYRKPLSAPLFMSNGDRIPGTLVPPPAPERPAPTPQHPLPRVAHATPHATHHAGPAVIAQPIKSAAPDVASMVREARRCADQGDWKGAEKRCAEALEQDRLCVPAHYLLGQVHEHEQRLDEALAAYRRTTFLDRAFIPGLVGQGNVWRQLGRSVEAQRCYRNALTQLGMLDSAAEVPGAEGGRAGEISAHLRGLLASIS
ncbi:MAG: hypothetical protein RLZZ387_2262 [Chloroflexota bacterium]|jgi:chemotaxis protein methyltransferase CheR